MTCCEIIYLFLKFLPDHQFFVLRSLFSFNYNLSAKISGDYLLLDADSCLWSESAFPGAIKFSFLDKCTSDPDKFRVGFRESYVTQVKTGKSLI